MRGRWVGCNVGGFYLCCGGRVVFCMRGFLGLSGAAVFFVVFRRWVSVFLFVCLIIAII